MKKILLGLGFLVLANSIVLADWIEPYIVGCKNNLYIGNAMIYGNLVTSGTLSASNGIVNVVQTWIDPVTASSAACQYTPVVSTISLQGAGTTWTTASGKITTNVGVYPRNISVLLEYKIETMADNSTTTVVGTCRVIGFDAKGEAADETIHICSTATLVTMTAFSKITSVNIKMIGTNERRELTGTPQPNISVYIGVGDKFGLANNITTAADVYKISEAGTNIEYDNASVDINTTYDTYDPVTNANASNDYVVSYKAKSR